MPMRAARRWSPAPLLGGLLLGIGLATPLHAATIADLTLVYDASFDGGSLDSSLDPLGFGPVQLTAIQGVAGSNPVLGVHDGYVELGITQPAGTTGLVSASAVITPVNFDIGSLFGLRATFLAPSGPHAAGNRWATVLGVRTGSENELQTDTRAGASVTVVGAGAQLNSPGAVVPTQLPLPLDIYDAIFDPVDPQPFTLELLVDRIAGAGNATLTVGSSVLSRDIQFAVFKADSGPAITALAPTLAIANAPGQSATVRLLDFQIFVPGNAVPEPATWTMMILGFGFAGLALRRQGLGGSLRCAPSR